VGHGQRHRRGGAWAWLALCLPAILASCGTGGTESASSTSSSTSEAAAPTESTGVAVTPSTAAAPTTVTQLVATTPTSTATAVTPASKSPTTTQRPTTTANPRPKVAYPSGGAVDPVFPPGDDAYTMLVKGQCTLLLAKTKEWDAKGVADVEGADTVFIYRSAAEACLQRWTDAVRDFKQVTTAAAQSDKCARTEAFKWVSALVAQHGGDAKFAPDFVAGSGRSPCATTTTTTTIPPTTVAKTTIPKPTTTARR
jgi:hypothetical protein